jgi:hypothetical protein
MRPVPLQTPLVLSLALLLSAVATTIPSCKRHTGPSAHYDRGEAIYQKLYAEKLDDAFLDAKMDEAVAELKQVEQSSSSWPVTQELLAQIDKGRKEAKAAADARQKELAATGRTPPPPPPVWNLPPRQPDEPEAVDAGTDAGPAAADPYGPGASVAEINKASGGCLVPDRPFLEGKLTGSSYKLAGTDACKDKLPGFAGQIVLAVDGRVYKRLPATDLKAVPAPSGTQLPGSPVQPGPGQPQADQQAQPGQPARPGAAPPPPSRPPAYEGQSQAVPLPESTAGTVDDATPKPPQ